MLHAYIKCLIKTFFTHQINGCKGKYTKKGDSKS